MAHPGEGAFPVCRAVRRTGRRAGHDRSPHQYPRHTATYQGMQRLYLTLNIFARLADDDMISCLIGCLLYTVQYGGKKVVIQFGQDHAQINLFAQRNGAGELQLPFINSLNT